MITFEKTVGNIEHLTKKITRKAVRAIILHNDKILLIRTSKGDLKFPGGGMEKGESFEEALVREVREETGYQNIACNFDDIFVIYTEKVKDVFEAEAIFESQSYYIFASLVNDERHALKLDDYEKELDFQAEWVDLKTAILENTNNLLQLSSPNPWVERELMVLKEIWNHINSSLY